MRPRPRTCIITAATRGIYNAKLIKHSVGARRQHYRLGLSTMANRPAYWVRLGRWIRGRCSECGARDWARPNDRKHATPVTTLRHLEARRIDRPSQLWHKS